jgi:hypothetical protein
MGGMNLRRNVAPLVIACAMVACIFSSVYAAAYLQMSDGGFCGPANETTRSFESEWAATIFWPASQIEQACAGYSVRVLGPND